MIFTDDHVAVAMPMSGDCALSQDGREAVLTPGDFAVVDTARPYQMAFEGIHRVLVIAAPRGLVRIPPEHLSRVTARRVSCRLVLDAGAWRPMECDKHVASTQFPEPALDLVAESLAELMSRLFELHPNSHQADLLIRIRQYIERNLGDPELGPQAIAAAHHISLRYLQKLFQSQGETVNGLIRDRRLDRCHDDLVDPRHNNRSIGAIGARWNLSPASYFSRVFRARYGLTPSEVRTNAGLQGAFPVMQTAAAGVVSHVNGSSRSG
jgi:AraC-like DNA-binding protein